MRTPEQNNVDRATIQQWNVAFEQRLPWDIAAEIAYVGTATDGGYADLNINYGEPGGGNAARKYFDIAGTTDRQLLGLAAPSSATRACSSPSTARSATA